MTNEPNNTDNIVTDNTDTKNQNIDNKVPDSKKEPLKEPKQGAETDSNELLKELEQLRQEKAERLANDKRSQEEKLKEEKKFEELLNQKESELAELMSYKEKALQYEAKIEQQRKEAFKSLSQEQKEYLTKIAGTDSPSLEQIEQFNKFASKHANLPNVVDTDGAGDELSEAELNKFKTAYDKSKAVFRQAFGLK